MVWQAHPKVLFAASHSDSEIAAGSWSSDVSVKVPRLKSRTRCHADTRWCGVTGTSPLHIPVLYKSSHVEQQSLALNMYLGLPQRERCIDMSTFSMVLFLRTA